MTPWKSATRGVPQGSCLSPLLFNILIRGLPTSSAANTWQFADDITQSVHSNNVKTIVDELANTYLATKNFCLSKNLEINPAKTQFIIFKNPAKKIPDEINLEIDTHSIKLQSQVKLLGMTLDRHLTFKAHITDVINTCNGYLGVLRRISNQLPRKLNLLFYTAIIRSHLEYASTLLTPAASSNLEKLDIIQRKAARIICNVPADSHAEPLLAELGLKSLHDRRLQRTMKIVTNSLLGNCHPELINKFLEDEAEVLKLKVPSTKTVMGRKRISYLCLFR